MTRRVLDEEIVASLFDICIGEDNQACNADAQNPVLSDMSKYVDLKYQFLVDNVQEENVRLRFVGTKNVVANMFTTNMGAIKICRLIRLAGMN